MAMILAVDDEAPILQLIKNGLEKDGHMVAAYTSAEQVPLDKLPNMPGGMHSLRRSCLAAQTMPESSQFIVSSILFLCYTVCENNSTLQSTAW